MAPQSVYVDRSGNLAIAPRLVPLEATTPRLLALLIEQQRDNIENVGGVTATLAFDGESTGLDVIYMSNGRPVAGEVA